MATVERIYDAIVAGAGVEGSATAHSLAKQGKDVLLLEQVGLTKLVPNYWRQYWSDLYFSV